ALDSFMGALGSRIYAVPSLNAPLAKAHPPAVETCLRLESWTIKSALKACRSTLNLPALFSAFKRCSQDTGVVRFDPVQAQVIEEVGEAHPGRQRVEVTKLRRQVARRHHQALIHQLAQDAHVFQGGLATEQQRDLLQLAF